MEQNHVDSLTELLAKLQPLIATATRGSIEAFGMHGCALRASVAKCFEFAAFANQEPPAYPWVFHYLNAARHMRRFDCFLILRGS